MSRLDVVLVERGFFQSRSKASLAIRLGSVKVNDERINLPSANVGESDVILVEQNNRYVSLGGEKLSRLLDETGYSPVDKIVLDVGASTGGFSDCLLQHGAARVVAIDVGRGQMHTSLLEDTRIELHEKTDIRHFNPGIAFELITVDVSFISVTKILSDLERLLAPEGDVMVLFKPQFEQKQRRKVKGGVLKKVDAEKTLQQFLLALSEFGWSVRHNSHVGREGGNYERMLWLRKKPGQQEHT